MTEKCSTALTKEVQNFFDNSYASKTLVLPCLRKEKLLVAYRLEHTLRCDEHSGFAHSVPGE